MRPHKKTSFRLLTLSSMMALLSVNNAKSEISKPDELDIFSPPAIVTLTNAEKSLAFTHLDYFASPLEDLALISLVHTRLTLNTFDKTFSDYAWSLLPDTHRQIAQAIKLWVNAPDIKQDKDRLGLRSRIAAAYMMRNFAPFWIEASGWRENAASILSRLINAKEDGLDLRAFRLPSIETFQPQATDELALSEAVATYALQARGARIDPSRLSKLIGAKPSLPDLAHTLTEVAEANAQAGDRLLAFNPKHEGYQKLRQKLVELYQIQAAQPPIRRVAEATEGVPQSDIYLTSSTSLQKNKIGKRSHIEAEIIANMERWRWLPQDLGETHIEVNIPDFELALVRNGAVVHRTRVVVGKEITPTPIFSDEMEYIIVNPYWNVPQSIIHKEMMPNGGPGDGFKVTYSNGQMVVRQPPGPTNALGNMKFVFPNDYAVYMHDTQSRHLFAQSHRAFSHGCMRVQNPFALAAAILGDNWPTKKLEKLIGPAERYINLVKPLPVHVQYFTTYVDASGRLITRPDLYGYSARVRRELGFKS